MIDATHKKRLNFDVYAWRYVHGDLLVIGTWYRNDQDDFDPCMVIMRNGELGRDKRFIHPPCLIRLTNAWIYTEEIGDPQAAAQEAVSIVETLDLGHGPKACLQVLGVIREHLDELIRMPLRPHIGEQHVGNIILTNRETGGREEHEVFDDV